jgi:hypothetical protein
MQAAEAACAFFRLPVLCLCLCCACACASGFLPIGLGPFGVAKIKDDHRGREDQRARVSAPTWSLVTGHNIGFQLQLLAIVL